MPRRSRSTDRCHSALGWDRRRLPGEVTQRLLSSAGVRSSVCWSLRKSVRVRSQQRRRDCLIVSLTFVARRIVDVDIAMSDCCPRLRSGMLAHWLTSWTVVLNAENAGELVSHQTRIYTNSRDIREKIDPTSDTNRDGQVGLSQALQQRK